MSLPGEGAPLARDASLSLQFDEADADLVARAFQGAAGALLTPSSLAVIVAAFAPEERGAAIGAWTAWGAIAAIAIGVTDNVVSCGA